MQSPKRKILIDPGEQKLRLLEGRRELGRYPVSTSPHGEGFEEGSLMTPTGNFVVVEKIGAGLPAATVFKGRLPLADWPAMDCDDDLVVGRILRLHGLDPVNSNTLARYIYIHGTNHVCEIGFPAGHGCIRLEPEDMLDLFSMVDVGTRVIVGH